jgi:hypothetical protein
MPDIPQPAITAAVRALRAHPWPDGETTEAQIATAVLEAAAPLLADQIARKILAHADDRWPSGCIGSQPARRHFRTAAQIAGLAFYTDEDMKRLAAEAIAAGNVAWCGVPEAAENVSAQAAPTGEDGERG